MEQRVELYINVIRDLDTKVGVKRVRYEHGLADALLKNNYSLQDYCLDKRNRNQANFLYAHAKMPYIDEGNSDAENSFFENNNVFFMRDREVECYGLYMAHLYHSFGIGFHSKGYWDKLEYTIRLVQRDKSKEVSVKCISIQDHVDDQTFIDWLINNNSAIISVPKSTTKVDDKSIHLRDDHGKNELQSFSKRLAQSPYVNRILNSLPWNSNDKDLIRKTYLSRENGLGIIEMVLHWTDKGLGVVVETTATNLIQLQWIAKHIREEYNHK